MEMTLKKSDRKDEEKPIDVFPGVAIDLADDNKVSEEAVDQYTKELNNNHRPNDP